MMKKSIVMTALLLLASGPVWAVEPAVEHGKKLFNDPGLGGSVNAKSCASCHPNGQGMEKAGKNPQLGERINQCITRPLAGQPLAAGSLEMRSLMLYINSLTR